MATLARPERSEFFSLMGGGGRGGFFGFFGFFWVLWVLGFRVWGLGGVLWVLGFLSGFGFRGVYCRVEFRG